MKKSIFIKSSKGQQKTDKQLTTNNSCRVSKAKVVSLNHIVTRQVAMIWRRFFYILAGSIIALTAVGNSFAHHDDDVFLNWGRIYERSLHYEEHDPFVPKNFQKFPYAFIKVGCERLNDLIFHNSQYLDDDNNWKFEKYPDLVTFFEGVNDGGYESEDGLTAFILECDTLPDLRHLRVPDAKETMKFSKMENAYKAAYYLVIPYMNRCGWDNAQPFCYDPIIRALLGARKAKKISSNPEARDKWLINYYKKQ